jgi:pyruvate formate lyase activating enzyme
MYLSENIEQRKNGNVQQLRGLIADIQTYSVNDGPGIRTTIFLKGCPLKCNWCHNPEMINVYNEVWYKGVLCSSCGKCIDVCPESAIKEYKDDRVIDRDACTACMKCVEVCPSNAMCGIGWLVNVEDALKEIQKSEVFYRRGGGGVTISGGEPLLQPRFTTEFLKECQKRLIHTALDTCGYAPWGTLSEVAKYADLILFDIKHVDPMKHEQGTHVSNELILENLKKLVKATRSIRIRIPIVPKFNDSEDDMRGIAELVTLNNLREVDLLPYHTYAEAKYKMLGRKYELAGTQPPADDQMQRFRAILQGYGLTVSIGG